MDWTKKHDKFALACNLSESQQLVLRDAMRKGKGYEPTEIEIDLRVTSRWIGKVRPKGEFHRKTMTNVMGHLEEKTQGMVTVLKKYNPWVYKILITPLSFVERIQSAKCASIPKLATGNPMFGGDHKNRARELLLQNISKLDNLFQKLGMHYSQDSLMKIWDLTGRNIANLSKAVNYMLQVHSTKVNRAKEAGLEEKGIYEPKGWLRDCLAGGWHLMKQTANLPLLEPNEHYLFDRPT